MVIVPADDLILVGVGFLKDLIINNDKPHRTVGFFAPVA